MSPVVPFLRSIASSAGGEASSTGSTLGGEDSWGATALAYDELRRLAQRYLGGERQDHTLQATALVHEAFLRLATRRGGNWQGKAHFFNTAAREMRRVLIDHARRRGTSRRGNEWRKEPLSENLSVGAGKAADLIALDRVLESLASVDERKARVVELRYFAGLTLDETAELLEVSRATVVREWRLARAWLRRELHRGLPPDLPLLKGPS
ncbi:MAG: sigma-70 family RNA polymerase sigma factor [Deltaproteobacteria bacterium]|nr:sigma-70 family RNA polymerase sigma factor [Deltaproteobacteria bacterium]